jgi:hypothetical protein
MKIALPTLALLRLEASSAAAESPNLSSSSSSTSLHRNRRETPPGLVATVAGAPPGRRKLSTKSSSKTFASTTTFGTDDLYFLASSSMSLSASLSFAYVEPDSPPGPDTPNGVDVRSIFADIAECAGVDMDVYGGDNCAFEHVLAVMTDMMTNDPTVVVEPVRRLVEGPSSSSSCDRQPSETEINLVASFLLEGADDKCTATEVEQTTSALIAIFKAPLCMGMTPCDEATVTTTSSSTATSNVADSTTTTAATSSATAISATTIEEGEEEGSKLPTTTTNATSVSTAYTPVVDELPMDETNVTHESHQKAVGNGSDKRNMLPLISIAGGLIAISAMVGGYYRKKNIKSGIIHPDEKSVQSIDSKSTNESRMSGSISSDDLESSKTSSLASMAAMSTLVANTSSSRVDRRVSI